VVYTPLLTFLQRVGTFVLEFLQEGGRIWLFFLSVLKRFRGKIYSKRVLEESLEIGVRSLGVVFLTGLFTGLVFALESSYAFRLFQAEGLIGPSVILSLTRELAPVLTAIMVTARAGSAMATELATMRVTEQIDALYVMGVDPIRYLVVPRIFAGSLMLPLLNIFFNIIGFIGAYGVTVYIVGVSRSQFLSEIADKVDLKDLYAGEVKAVVFGFLITLLSSYFGYQAYGGARGVGLSATKAVVVSCVAILMADYFLTAMIFGV
jgi:phospholipid/cholesterol/gamma-HCH transport system permease protein